MRLTQDQTEVLQRINDRLVRGDIREIANTSKMHRYTVSKCLSLNVQSFNQDIVDIAVARIAAREQSTKNSLIKIAAY